jgi:thymidylate synthase
MQNYHDLVELVINRGDLRGDRTHTGTRSIFSPEKLRFDLQKGFPLLTTKKINFKNVASELLWFLSGGRNVDFLHEYGNKIWDEWANEVGDLGRIYGVQWRKWRTPYDSIDQIQTLITQLKNEPNSRRHLVSAWNVGELEQMALPPCHFTFQCYVDNGRLNLVALMRSADLFLGVPYNIASYALLTHFLARATGLQAGELVLDITGDAHVYLNHIEQCELLLSRPHKEQPTLHFSTENIDIDNYDISDFELVGYEPHPFIKADIAV